MTAATIAALLVSAVALAALVVDTGTHNVEVPDKFHSSGLVDIGNASVEYIGSDAANESSGTGIFDPFVRLQGAPTERGYNTDGTVQFDTKVGKWTHAIKANAIPIVSCVVDNIGTVGLCWELFVDINESNTAKYISLNEVEIWFTDSATLSGYPFTASATTFQVYDFTGEILIHDVNQGSGRGDLRYLVELASIDAWDSDTYFVLYSAWGTTATTAPDGKTYGSEGGFEEWKVRKTPNVGILKTANPAGPVNAGSAIGFDITVSNTGVAPASNVTINDPLPAGGSLDWSMDPVNSNCSITGAVGSEVLSCTFATLAAGASVTIHITSATTAADCGVVSNTATITSGGSGSSTASVTVSCGALQITKTAKHAGAGSADLAGRFTVVDANGDSHTLTTDATGVGCIDGIAVGETTSITEVAADFPGYDVPAIPNVTVAAGACSGTPTNVDVENTPLTDVDITVDSLHNGATSTTIECWGAGSDPATDPPDYTTTVSDGTLSIDNLDPTDPTITLNCQITIDP
jgi:uncharacterized repeat protein (TIGR01451 family)